MQNNNNVFLTLDKSIQDLYLAKDKKQFLLLGILAANEFMHILGIPYNELDSGEKALDKALSNSKFKNQKMEQWFEKHPYLGGARAAFYHFMKDDANVESMLYMISDTPRKERIAVTTQLTSNWEDSELTMIPQYKVGIDFFLCFKTKSLFVVLTKERKLRVLELNEKLTHTQIEILNKIQNVALLSGIDPKTGENIPLEPQRTIHKTLWNAFELREVNKQFYIGISDHFHLLCQYIENKPPKGLEKTNIKEGAKIFASRLIGRLLFIWFLKKKEIIDSKQNYFNVNDIGSSDYYEKRLKVLFFNTLNMPVSTRKQGSDLKTPYLNGGLFEAHETDWPKYFIYFPEGWFYTLYNHFSKFNFTTDESSPEYEQIAIDPEMLGRIFENLLASIVPETSKMANERNSKGAFYTPREIVNYMCKISLKEYLKRNATSDKDYDGIEKLVEWTDAEYLAQKSTGISEIWGNRSEKVRTKLIDALNNLKIFDPACGSGAFPIGMLQLLLKVYDRLNAFYDISLKKMRIIRSNEHNDAYLTKLFIIRNTLYGSDIEPMAIEISRLRAWLSLIIDDKKYVEPLPNLDFNFVCANSLVPLKDNDYAPLLYDNQNINDLEAKSKNLQEKYFNAHNPDEKAKLRQEYKELMEKLESGTKYFDNEELEQLKTWNPFSSYPASFFDSKKMLNVSKFDIVIGNPPYIQLQSMKEVSKKLYAPLNFETYNSMGDIYCLFIEKGVQLLKDKGILTFITSNKWMRAGYGEQLRAFLSKKTNPLVLIDFGGTKVFESATVDTDIIQVAKEENSHSTNAIEIKENCLDNLSNYIKQHSISMKFINKNSWIICSSIDSKIKQKILSIGKPLKLWDLEINYGIKTGLNEAFIIKQDIYDKLLKEDPKNAEIIRPILRGRDIKKYSYSNPHLYIITTFPSKNIDINNYPSIKDYLLQFGKERLEQTGLQYIKNGIVIKSRKKTSNKWFETQDSISYWNDFMKQKIIYPNMTEFFPFYYDEEGFYTNQKCFIITGKHIEYLTAFLNSKLFKFCFKDFFPRLGDKGRELSKIFFVKIPVIEVNKKENDKFRLLIIKIQKNKLLGNDTANLEKEIDDLIYKKYALTNEEIKYIESSDNI